VAVNPAQVCLFIPAGLKKFKLDLFNRIGKKIEAHGGRVVHHDPKGLEALPPEVTPIVGCMPECVYLMNEWWKTGRQWIYWDRGYARRVFATWLPRGANGGYYRWHLNTLQMNRIADVPGDRWQALKIPLRPWRKGGDKIIVASTLHHYFDMFGVPGWPEKIAAEIRTYTKRPVIVRHKETTVPLDVELADAHCLVAHGSIAAVEAVIMGCPVFVDKSNAAALVGRTDFREIDHPVYPDNREAWVHSLAYSQFNEQELVDGTLWKLIT